MATADWGPDDLILKEREVRFGLLFGSTRDPRPDGIKSAPGSFSDARQRTGCPVFDRCTGMGRSFLCRRARFTGKVPTVRTRDLADPSPQRSGFFQGRTEGFRRQPADDAGGENRADQCAGNKKPSHITSSLPASKHATLGNVTFMHLGAEVLRGTGFGRCAT